MPTIWQSSNAYFTTQIPSVTVPFTHVNIHIQGSPGTSINSCAGTNNLLFHVSSGVVASFVVPHKKKTPKFTPSDF